MKHLEILFELLVEDYISVFGEGGFSHELLVQDYVSIFGEGGFSHESIFERSRTI